MTDITLDKERRPCGSPTFIVSADTSQCLIKIKYFYYQKSSISAVQLPIRLNHVGRGELGQSL